jgi:hypothetical protein
VSLNDRVLLYKCLTNVIDVEIDRTIPKNISPNIIGRDTVSAKEKRFIVHLPTTNFRSFVFAAMAVSVVAYGQTPLSSADSVFQIGYASNVNIGDSYVNISNDGASMTTISIASGSNTLAVSGSICANVYAFNPDEELLSCCSCPITPNGLVSLSVQRDLLNNTLTGRVNPSAVVIKMIGSTPPIAGAGGTTATPCGNSASGLFSVVARGMVGWVTSLHANTAAVPTTYAVTENPFTPGDASPSEITRIANTCTFFQAQGSGNGICNSCELAGQGASAVNQ